jgi:hypothetical protein
VAGGCRRARLGPVVGITAHQCPRAVPGAAAGDAAAWWKTPVPVTGLERDGAVAPCDAQRLPCPSNLVGREALSLSLTRHFGSWPPVLGEQRAEHICCGHQAASSGQSHGSRSSGSGRSSSSSSTARSSSGTTSSVTPCPSYGSRLAGDGLAACSRRRRATVRSDRRGRGRRSACRCTTNSG